MGAGILRFAIITAALCAAAAYGVVLFGRASAGESLLYNGIFRGNAEMVVRDLGTGIEYNLTHHSGTDESGAWSPDGQRMAFVSSRDERRRLYILSLQPPTGIYRLPLERVAFGSVPVWSPDGSRLIAEIDDGRAVQLFMIDVTQSFQTGVNPRQLTYDVTDSRFPDWSPDGSRIAFVAWRDGNAEIYTIATDGTSLTNLTRHPDYDTAPSWSPDGARIAFYSDRTDSRELYVMDSSGGDVRQYTFDNRPLNTSFRSAPSWSPDGSQIAFVAPVGMYGDIVLIDANGTNQRRMYIHMLYDTSPLWLADSSGFIYMSYLTGRWALYAKPLDGSAYPITAGGGGAGYASWWWR